MNRQADCHQEKSHQVSQCKHGLNVNQFHANQLDLCLFFSYGFILNLGDRINEIHLMFIDKFR